MMRTALLGLAAACLLSAGCGESAGERPAATAGPNASPPAAAPPTPETTPAQAAARPPTLEEARAALGRVYGQTLAVEEKRPDALVAGDFNGDGSEDLAAAVRAAPGALAELNGEFPNWIVVDPSSARPFDPGRRAQTPPPAPGPPKIEERDPLLAILHGHGPAGWRAAEATQSYLLKGGAGEGMRSVPVKDYPPALQVRRSLNPRSDVISGRLGGGEGFLYWSRGKYIWQRR